MHIKLWNVGRVRHFELISLSSLSISSLLHQLLWPRVYDYLGNYLCTGLDLLLPKNTVQNVFVIIIFFVTFTFLIINDYPTTSRRTTRLSCLKGKQKTGSGLPMQPGEHILQTSNGSFRSSYGQLVARLNVLLVCGYTFCNFALVWDLRHR